VGRVGANKASGVQQVLTIVAREQTATQEAIYWNCIRDCLSVKVVSDVFFGFLFIFIDGDRTVTHFTIVIPEQTATRGAVEQAIDIIHTAEDPNMFPVDFLTR
jgi:hypothetical protein